jgi:hypothetical protein
MNSKPQADSYAPQTLRPQEKEKEKK